MRFFRQGTGPSLYFVAGPILHKCLEVGFQRWLNGRGGLDVYWRFRTRGDHAGLTFYVEFFGWFFEFNVHDHRHWNWDTKSWKEDDDESLQDH